MTDTYQVTLNRSEMLLVQAGMVANMQKFLSVLKDGDASGRPEEFYLDMFNQCQVVANMIADTLGIPRVNSV